MLTLRVPRTVSDDIIATGLTYWERLRGGRRMPSRADIDPCDIRNILSHVMLVDVLRDPLDFRFRLVGGEIERVVRFSPRGHHFSRSRGFQPATAAWSDYERTVTLRRPVNAPLHYRSPERSVIPMRHCLMPLAADGETVNMIFAVVAIEG